MFGIDPNFFDKFRADMQTKWRYQYGDVEARKALTEAQALLAANQASIMVPAEAAARYAQADLYRSQMRAIPYENEQKAASAELLRAQAALLVPAEAKLRLAQYEAQPKSIERLIAESDPELVRELFKLFDEYLRGGR